MHDLYDRLEGRTPTARETALFRDLRHILSISKPRAPALRAQLKGIPIAKPFTRADLARIPIVRHADLAARQHETPPFGGYAAKRMGALAHTFVAYDGVASPAGLAKDWWGVGRALYAAGLRKGMLALNSFSYDLVPHGHMIDSAARALGCALIPAGNAPISRTAAAVARFKPDFFCGPLERLDALLDYAQETATSLSSISGAFVTGTVDNGRRSKYEMMGIDVRPGFVNEELGLIAYSTHASDGMVLNEGLVLEIVDPSTGMPVAAGTEGEIVVSRINSDYPLLRFGTGSTAAVLEYTSACGRTNTRISLPRSPQKDGEQAIPFMDASQLAEFARHVPAARRLRVSRRSNGGGPHVKIEIVSAVAMTHLRETLLKVAAFEGTVELVEPGTLCDDETIVIGGTTAT